ncbi:restriction endonuclease [Metabacillus schmidteae]|uniref:restriction endonuclease n=1 Tax=Metabacillus schmidteae TaxID=2730405 RepID=UPI0015893EF1|nr:restriction endonuclease [Metabacillus schmidteae]
MLFIEGLAAIILLAAFVHFTLSKKKNEYESSLLAEHIDKSDEMKRTLAMGLYLRFKKENHDNPPTYSSNYIKQDPAQFEHFVAEVIELAKGGSTWVSRSTGDFGIDFEHRTNEGLFLGQVKCYQGDLGFDPIALVHSNMVKDGAKGGYVITTGSFTKAARQYAEGLDIELIDGVKLVELWLAGLQKSEVEIKGLIPRHI